LTTDPIAEPNGYLLVRMLVGGSLKLEVSQISANLKNHSIGPTFFCAVDVLATKCVEKGSGG